MAKIIGTPILLTGGDSGDKYSTNTGNPINSAVKSIDFTWSNLTASAELDLTDVTGEYYVAIYWDYPKTLYYGYINTIQLLG